MTCRNCGSENEASAKYCRTCGVPALDRDQARTQPIYARVIEPKLNAHMLIVIAVLAGLAVGVFVFSRASNRRSTEPTAPAAAPEMAPDSVPAPKAQSPSALDEQPPPEPTRRAKAHAKPAHESSSPPQLLATDTRPGSPSSQTAIAPAPQPSPQRATAPPMPPRAVQETDSESPPLPLPSRSRTADPQPPGAPPSPPLPDSLPPQPPPEVAYRGPMAGMATWTGKLGKEDSLTITGGTPSTGLIFGAGLPGVPVRITVDQTNLGFSEMPNRANGYRRLVLRSHSKHDKITIHWTVVGQ